MFDYESRREDARAESLPVSCPECGDKREWDRHERECPLCDNYTRCPECWHCVECGTLTTAKTVHDRIADMIARAERGNIYI